MRRALDVLLAVTLLIVTLPLSVACFVGTSIATGGRPLFRQERVGRGGDPFMLVKFRSMTADAPREDGASGSWHVTAQDDPRITRWGRILRASKLDELPQLWNVLLGDMSIVGPRPDVPEVARSCDPRWHRCLQVRPGLTGPASVALYDEEQLLSSVVPIKRERVNAALQNYKLDVNGRYAMLDSGRMWVDVVTIAASCLIVVRAGRFVKRPYLRMLQRRGMASGPPPGTDWTDDILNRPSK